MESRSHALVVGFFILGLVAAVLLAFYWLQGDKIPQTEYYIVTDSAASGLSQSSDVRLRGLSIGKIISFHFDPKNRKRVLIKVRVNSDVPITSGTYAKTIYQGITGQAAIELDEEPGVHPHLVGRDGELPRIPMKPSVIDTITEYSKVLFRDTQRVMRQVEKLLNDENLTKFSSILANTETATNKLSGFIDDLGLTNTTARSSLENVNHLVTNQGATAFGSVQSLVEEARIAVQNIEAQSSGLSGDVRDDVLPRLNRTLEELEQTTYRIDRLADGLTDDPSVIIRGVESRPGPGESGFDQGESK